MPLPTNSVKWPPPSTEAAKALYDEYGTWYSGDPQKLATLYQDVPGLDSLGPGAELPGGQPPRARFLTNVARGIRRFWGAQTSPGQIQSHKLHIPLASNIAMTNANLLYGEPPTFTAQDGGTSKGAAKDGVRVVSATQQALDDIHEEANVHAVLLESGEIGSAYGGSFVRVTWDPVIAEVPLYDCIPPDTAIPEWRSGRLAAVTFYRELDSIDGKWWWHLERHEAGRVLHGVYRSTEPDRLGQRRRLEDHPQTVQFALLVNPNGDRSDNDTIATGCKGLAVDYIPNMLPNRLVRGSRLGRSDFDGIVSLFDALDEAWTSWLRDLRLGKGRIVVPSTYLKSHGRGKGASFDAEREVYEQVETLAQGGAAGGLALQVVQFAIRVEEHSRTCREIVVAAVGGAGFSPQTFGESDQVAATATEVTAREGASYRTRGRKITYARGPLARLDRAALEIYIHKFGPDKAITPGLSVVKWPDGVAVDPESTARTLSLLQAAEAASIRTRVALLNPDWQKEEIDAEVIRIREDQAAAQGPPAPEPGFGATGHGLPGSATGNGGASKPAGDATSPAGDNAPRAAARGAAPA